MSLRVKKILELARYQIWIKDQGKLIWIYWNKMVTYYEKAIAKELWGYDYALLYQDLLFLDMNYSNEEFVWQQQIYSQVSLDRMSQNQIRMILILRTFPNTNQVLMMRLMVTQEQE